MTAARFAAAPALALAALVGLAGTARADKIDGDWCAPDGARSLAIDGPAITTPGGHAIQGDYSRHQFRYVVPPGEPGAGSAVTLRLRNETTVEIGLPSGTETWHRCQLNS